MAESIHIGVITDDDNHKVVALCGVYGAANWQESLANAALMSASPIMLLTLIDAHERLAELLGEWISVEETYLPAHLAPLKEIVNNISACVEKINAEVS